MNNFIYTVLNAVMPVIYIGMSVDMHVKCVIGHTVIKETDNTSTHP
jgi:hypothetical protein